ncbi:SUZ domain [Arabidopsis suecica]|uniref:SUZ domain n=1 Tax=Arabidopsis suecica TaxID=45249 RepID=A0A8T2DD89_ARASU|nr:SUZ domain [Arabidopsis suecica]
MAAMSDKEAMVDPFLVEALQNPRHRLTILRMELDIQKFFQSPEQQQYEFQPLPTSYLRLIAHRVAQHYGLFTTALEGGGVDGSGNRILATKTVESRYPYVCLSEIPVKQPEIHGRPEGFKIAIKPRPNRGAGGSGSGSGVEKNLLRSVEERKEEYDKARARIFNSPSSSDSEDSSTRAPPPPYPRLDSKHNTACPSRNETEVVVNYNSNPVDVERNGVIRDSGRTSRVAIIRDREKDRYDPDYDRNRYVRVAPPVQNFNPIPIPLPFHDAIFPQMPRNQASLNYGHPLNPAMTAPSYTEWPSATMTYAQTLNASDVHHFRHPNP